MNSKIDLSLRNLYSLILTVVAWIIPIVILSILNKDVTGSDSFVAYRTGNFFDYLIISAFLLGSLNWMLNRITDFPNIRKLSMGLIIGIRSLSFLLILILYDLLDIMVIFDKEFGDLPKIFTPEVFTSSHFYGTLFYILFVDTIYGWFYQIRAILGENTFRNLLLGKYRKPRAEKRIFMFIDMKDSTTHAELLGHVKFTRLIQECFRDFGIIARKRKVDIYQYIGDEVVVSWDIKLGIQEQNCLRLFFDFRDKLQKNWPDYQGKYNIKPVFKAGIHSGHVTVAEIGLFKRGIEYLSDVLNTASRIQGMCNEFQADLLISGDVYELIDKIPDIQMEFVENVQLKGKENKVEIYSVNQAGNKD
jgi:adenylate cyclase